MLSSAEAVKLLAELLELDQVVRDRRRPSTLLQKQRRAAIVRDLQLWALKRQQSPDGAQRREYPRAPLKLRVQMLGGPRPLELKSDSLAVGGLSVLVSFAPRRGDLLPLKLVPAEPDPPIEVGAEVMWYDPFRGRAGLRFVDLSEDARAMVERLVFVDLVAKA